MTVVNGSRHPAAIHSLAVISSSSCNSRLAASSGSSPSSNPPLNTSTDSLPIAYLNSRAKYTVPSSSIGNTEEPCRIVTIPNFPGVPPGRITLSSLTCNHGVSNTTLVSTTLKGPWSRCILSFCVLFIRSDSSLREAYLAALGPHPFSHQPPRESGIRRSRPRMAHCRGGSILGVVADPQGCDNSP